jgi:ankyrin repeat protein
MSFFKRLSTGFKSPAEPSTSPDPQSASESNQAAASTVSDSPQPPAAAEPSTSPDSQFASESNQAAASRVSDSPQTPAAVEKTSPFEFWKSNLTVQSVDDAKSKLLDLNAKDPYGEPALIRAARHGDTTVIMALLAAGADIDSTDNSGETAMSWAAQMGKTEVLKILLDRPDVHIDKSDKGGRTALYDACCCQFRYIYDLYSYLKHFSPPCTIQ